MSYPEFEDASYWENRSKDDSRKDWNDDSDWITGYANSINHPHRQLIIDELNKIYPFDSLLELGCNAGPNLMRIRESFPSVSLYGIDANRDVIEKAQDSVPGARFEVRRIDNLPFWDKEFDVVLCDAVLLYVGPDEIEKVMSEMKRVANKAIILVEWFSDKEEIKNHHWARPYDKLLEDFGLVEVKPLDIWPNKSWQELGKIFVSRAR